MTLGDLSIKEKEIIDYVRENRGVSINQIAKALKIDYKNCHRYCQRLNEKGLILISKNPNFERGSASKVSFVDLNTFLNNNPKNNLIKVLEFFKDKPKKSNDILDYLFFEDLHGAYTYLLLNGYLEESTNMTEKGEKFLKEHSK